MSFVEIHDVLIVGAGPAGLMSATVLCRMGVKPMVVDATDYADHQYGRSDALHCRAMEVMESLGLPMDQIRHMGRKLYGRSFWENSGNASKRTAFARFYPTFLDLNEDYALCLRQGLIEQVLLQDAQRHEDGLDVQWGWRFLSMELAVGPDGSTKVLLENSQTHEQRTVFARYVLACDGGKSQVRRWAAPLGVSLKGEALSVTWCVLDAVGINSDFPDLERLSVIRSDKGIVLIIPREPINGKPAARFDIQLEKSRDEVGAEDITHMIKEIFKPFRLDWDEVNWWSSYDVGQRLINQYDVDNKVFFIGDACHTHSPRAGLGLNTALLEAHNLGWKLALVLKKLAGQELLATYASERYAVAEYLVNMDRELVGLYAGLENQNMKDFSSRDVGEWLERLRLFQTANFSYQAGASIVYEPSVIVRTASGKVDPLEVGKPGIPAGSRTRPARVTRLSDSNPVNAQPAFDGRFAIYVMAGNLEVPTTLDKLKELDTYLRTSGSIFARYGQDVDVHAKPISRRMPSLAAPGKEAPEIPTGRALYTYSYDDIPQITDGFCAPPHSLFRMSVVTTTSSSERVILDGVMALAYPRAGTPEAQQPSRIFNPSHLFCDDIPALSPFRSTAPEVGDILEHPMHAKWAVDEKEGAIIVARPDGHVGMRVEGFGEAQWAEIEKYFDEFLQ
ncbi:unnamed protein product [Peniophora sp. CBMAI 1063]|nr:unnamed protein product [Peniophora sp. CBMAI 1063]